MSNGLRCPLCGSWYSTEPSMLNSGFSAGDVCGNEAMTGPNPEKCSPDHPCPGILIPDDRKGVKSGQRGGLTKPEKKGDDLANPRVWNTATGKFMTNEEVEIADIQRREKRKKCVRKCPAHNGWCERKLGHPGVCMCEECKKDD